MFCGVGGGGVYSFSWPLGVCVAHQGMTFSGLLSWKGCLFGRKVFPKALKWVWTLPICGLHEWHQWHFLKLFILWCHLFNKILNSVCEIKSGLQKKYPVLHRVTKGTELEGLSRANIYKTWDHGLWMTLVDLCFQDPFYRPRCPNYPSFWRRTIPVIWPNFRDFNNIGLYYYH